ncbi:TRANSDUCIN/WD40 REPEAT-LIKE SUPERFAMILY PROTEIN [Salix viminalis]|uniref:TRANSDUCIN/WD40 REPEAT-LIKE SUPERFAMILY PROTEIN n=1 Tax=Salix viminalis TaxID=40686 RepID=A0A9Q0TMH6_SALVM|nr:TRANSDUCIN/WD40 REPEAT-LIKE SUPERFAMILY PROTEIN [Salix viminalis]
MIKMGNSSEEEEQEPNFFDTREEISSVSDWSSDCGDCSPSVLNSFLYDDWTRKKNPESVQDRRRRFLKWMGLSLDRNEGFEEDSGDDSKDKIQWAGVDRTEDNSGAVLRTSRIEDAYLVTQSSMSSDSNEVWRQSFENSSTLDGNIMGRIKNLDDGTGFLVDELDKDGMLNRLPEVGSNQSPSFEGFRRTLGTYPLLQRFLKKYANDGRAIVEAKRSWLKKLGLKGRVIDRQGTAASKPCDLESTTGAKMHRVKVHPSKKHTKELSSLFTGQEFLAHKGSILTMKFSLDGQYLATGGEDGIVRVWKVIEDNSSNQFDIPDTDTSCLYFTMNHLSELASLDVDKKGIDKMKRRGTSDSTCVVVPPKVFRVLEKSLHEFEGHNGEVLDLSWSKKRFLLSSSVDKTVRLWQVGCDRCLRVFSHNNYVTSVNFNPVDDNYFISGSIDGKVRIWEVLDCRVVDYTDIREIITAACYRPGGKGGLVGTMSGNCLFYDITDNRLQLAAQICLQGKKKLPGRRITGFEFSPSDPSKLIVTSADSLVRVICGLDVICKFRASSLRANQTSASFTSDGKHIISTSEDSSVYIWNYTGQERTFRTKNIQSCESFLSQNASVAIPWRGIETIPETLSSPETSGDVNSFQSDRSCPKFCGELEQKRLSSSSPSVCFSLARGFLLESLTKGSATWPEEKLPNSSRKAASPTKSRPEFKYLKECLSEYVKLSLVGSCYCNCRLGRADQNIPQLWFTSSIVRKTNQGFNERYRLGYFHAEKG